MTTRATLLGTIVLLIALFFALNMVAGFGLRGARFDATEGGIYTLTKGSKNIAKSPDEPISLTLYYSAKLAQGRGEIPMYAQRVRETLDEYVRQSGGKIKLTVVDPEPFSEAEDKAVAAGMQGIPVSAAGENVYFGLVGTNSADGKEQIPFFDPSKERFLEYDLSKLVYSLAHPKKKVVGLIAGIQIEGGFSMDPMTRQPKQTPAWYITSEIKTTFELRNLGKEVKQIPEDVSVLMVVHPKDLSDATLYAIDQYVLKGGKALFFVDPSCENDRDQTMQGMPPMKVSNLDKILNAWGVEVVAGRFAADINATVRVPLHRGEAPTPYLAVVQLKEGLLNKEDPVTGQAETVTFATPGIIRAKAPEKKDDKKDAKEGEKKEPNGAADASNLSATITWLGRTSERAMMMPAATVAMQADPKQLLKEYAPGFEALTVAARLSGRVKSAFPGGRPGVEGEKPEDAEKFKAGFLTESKEPINVILFADVDFLANSMWVQVQDFFGQQIGRKVSDNGDVVMTALDNLCGSTDLISVRARRESARPFTLVEEMQKRADQKLLSEQQALEKKVEDTQKKINELQAGKTGDEKFVLTPEQQAEIEKLRKEYSETRQQLRNVKGNLRKDIERLGTELKFINIGLIPVLVSLGAVGLGAYRVSRRRSKPRD